MWRVNNIKSEYPIVLQIEWEKSDSVIKSFSFDSQLITCNNKVLRNSNSNIQAGLSMIKSKQEIKRKIKCKK